MTALPKIELIPTKNLTHREWIDKRKLGIGGSDTGTMLDLNKYKSRIDLWKEKTDQKDCSDDEMSEGYALIGELFKRTLLPVSLLKGLNLKSKNAIT